MRLICVIFPVLDAFLYPIIRRPVERETDGLERSQNTYYYYYHSFGMLYAYEYDIHTSIWENTVQNLKRSSRIHHFVRWIISRSEIVVKKNFSNAVKRSSSALRHRQNTNHDVLCVCEFASHGVYNWVAQRDHKYAYNCCLQLNIFFSTSSPEKAKIPENSCARAKRA